MEKSYGRSTKKIEGFTSLAIVNEDTVVWSITQISM